MPEKLVNRALSRQTPSEVFLLLSRLTDAGVSIATVDGDHVYSKGSLDFPSLINMIVKAQLSHEESQKKSHRLSAAWASKRARAGQGDKRALTRRCPAWIEVCEQSGQYIVREDRATIVRRIFDLSMSGHGKHLIAGTLNKEAVPCWGRSDNGWHPSYIQKILASRATVGEFQPHKKVAGKRSPEGPPLAGLYPAVIDEAQFARAQADRKSRTVMRGRRGRGFSNLLSGLAVCSACGNKMTYRNKGAPGEQYLVCDAALRQRGCTPTTYFRYNALEAAVLDQTLLYTIDERHFAVTAEVETLQRSRAKLAANITELDQRQHRIVDMLSRKENSVAEGMLVELSAAALDAKGQIRVLDREILVARGRASPKENIAHVRKLLRDITSVDEEDRVLARAKTQQALREIAVEVICDPVASVTTIIFGSRKIALDKAGKIIATDSAGELGLNSLLGLRERGWVLVKHREHPVLGRVNRSIDGE